MLLFASFVIPIFFEKKGKSCGRYLHLWRCYFQDANPLQNVNANKSVYKSINKTQFFLKWKTWKALTIDSKKDLLLARLVINSHRRSFPDSEKTELLDAITEETKWTPKEIANQIGMSSD